MRFPLISILYMLALTQNICAQAVLNLDFEYEANNFNPLLLWAHSYSETFITDIDTAKKVHGSSSLLIDGTRANPNSFFRIYNRSLPVNEFRGRTLTITGYFSGTNTIESGGFYASIFGNSERTDYKETISGKMKGKDFVKIVLKIYVPVEAKTIAFGIELKGAGKLWVDKIQLYNDEHEYLDQPLEGTEFLIPGYINSKSLVVSKTNGDYRSINIKNIGLENNWGKTLKISGQNIAEHYPFKAELYLSYLITNEKYKERYKYVTYELDSISGNFEITAKIPDITSLSYVSCGFNIYSDTNVNTSNVLFTIDDTEIDEEKTSYEAHTDEEIKWLNSNVVSLGRNNGKEIDVSLIEAFFSSSRIIGLGEVTHGSHEIFILKSQIIKYLIENKGFRLFILEADMAAAERINAYVKSGDGNPKELLKNLGFWTWHTDEILGLIKWIRTYNLKNPLDQVIFAGIDFQMPQVSLENLKQFFTRFDNKGLAAVEDIEKLIARLHYDPSKRDLEKGIKDSLLIEIELKLNIISQQIELLKISHRIIVMDEINAHSKYIGLISQYVTMKSVRNPIQYRDASMAQNLIRLDERYFEPKSIIWAHNNHISKSDNRSSLYHKNIPLGEWLKNTYGDTYFALAFTFYEGSYNAIVDRKVQATKAQAPYFGTVEYLLNLIDKPLFALNLRDKKIAANNKWIFERSLLRDVGAVKESNEFQKHRLYGEYDALIFLKSSSESHLISK